MSTFAEYTKKQKKKSVENTSFREYTKSVLGDSFEDDIAPMKSGGSKTESKKKDKKESLLGDIELVKKDTIFDDGYQFGDVTKSTFANLGKFATGVAKGALAPVEGISDLLLHGAAGVSRFVGADGLAETLKKEANINTTQGMFAPVDKYLDKYSTMGRTLEAANEGIGQVASLVGGGAALKAAGLGATAIDATTKTLLGASAAGSGISEAYQGGATDEEALKHGLNTGISAVMTEMLFGGLGKTINAVGFSKGLSSADDILAQKLTGKINNVVARNVGQFAIKSGAEGVEEILDGVANAVSKKMTYMSEEDINDIIADENLLESFVVGTLSSAAMQSGVVPGTKAGSLIEANKNKTDFITGYTDNEQKVIDKVVEERIAERETDGKKLTTKEKANIEEAVKKDLEKGYIDTDTIESVLGGETYEGYKSLSDKEKSLQEEIKTLQSDPRASAQTRLAEAKAELDKIEKGTEKTELKERLSSEVRNLAMSDRLLESYNEKGRKTQKFAADLSQYDEKAQMTVKKAVESGILNNTNRTHDFVDMVAKLSADKGVLFDFTNNENLKKSGFAIEGKTINGLVKDNDIILNIDSQKALNTVVGHEITHVLEGTELYAELQNAVKAYAETKGEYSARLKSITALYDGVKDANIEAEITADLIGDYLFTDSDFISKLSTENRNIFQKIYDEVKYLCKIVTAGSKEARQLEEVKRAFEKAYKESGKNNSETKYSVSDSNIKISVNDYHSGEMFATMTYEKDGKVVGTLDYSEYEGKPNVKMIEVTPEYRRNGIGKKLLQELQRQYPDVEIDYGMTTPDGTMLLDAITYTQTDEQVAKGKQKLSELQTELENVENRLNELYEIDELTAEQQEEMEQLGERWDELYYTEIPKLTEEYGDKSESKRFVKMDDVKYSLTDSAGNQLSPAIQNRFANSKAVDENGNLKVLYHGTASGEFTIFDKSKGSVEGDFGSGFYFTDNEADVSEHYEGGGPDFENKVARRAEQLEWEEELDYSEAEARAREELFKGSHKFEVYLNIEKPAIVGETILFDPDEYYSQYDRDDYDSEEDYEGDVEQLVSDDIDNIIWDIERNVDVNSTDGIAEILWNALNEGGIDVESLKAQVNELYLEDSNGNMVGNEVARQIIESLGYDGIIDPTVSGKWNMDMEAGTTHYIVFKPNQIKAVSNENPTDNPDINLSLSKKGNIAPVGNYNVYGDDIRLEQSAPVEEQPIAPIEEQQSKEHFSLDDAEDTVESEEDGHIAGEDLTKKNADRIKVIQSEVKGYRLTKDVTNKEFADKIAKKEAEYEALQRKDTKKAMDLRNQITRLEARRDSLIKSLDGKIERANKRIERIENESRFEKRKSKQNQYRELFGRIMGDTSTWVDKKLGIQYQTNTLRRNLRDIVRDAGGKQDIATADAIYDELQGSVNRNEAKKNREANNLKNMFREMKINNTESTYIQMLGELRHNPDTTLTQDVVDEFYKNNKKKIDTKKVDNAIEEARKLYDSLYDRVNAALSEHGFKEMGYRKGYFPHFTDPKQNWLSKLLNWKVQNDEIPTDIAGLTELFEPQRTWQSFDKHRMSDTTDYNFLKGLDNYVNGALDWIYHIEDIQKHRAFETEIRYRHSSEAVQKKIDEYRNNPMLSTEEVESLIQNVLREAKNPLNNFVTDLHTRTNILAGKKSSKDRNMESDLNRHAYSVMTNVTNRVTANQVVGSISSAMTNFIPITQSWGQVNPTSSLVGMKKTIQSYMKDDGVIAKSDFLTNRLAMNEALYKDAWDKIGDKVGCLMEIADNFTSQTVWRSKYYENIKNGMTEAQAIKDADQFAENVIGGRSKGNQPTIFHAKNPVTKMLTSFQLEVSNQYGYMFKDMPQDIGKNALGKLTKGYATMFVGAYAYNALYSTLTGRDAAFDPIGIIKEFIGDLFGDDDEEENVADAIAGLASNVADEIPFIGGLLGGGRIPISSALPYNASISDAYADVVAGDWKSVMDEMSKPLYYGVLPMGGGQIRKTVQGLSMFDDDHPVSGSYTKSGNLRYPVEDTIANRFQAALFGQYSSSTAREYFDRGEAPLKEKQIQEYADLDMPIREYWDYRKGLKKQETLEDKFEYIADLDVSVEQKNIMINNIVDRKEKVDMSNYDDFANYEEFDFYVKNTEKYNFLQEYDVTYNEYKASKDSKEKYDSIYNWYKNNPEKVTLSRAVTDDVIKYREYTSDLNDIRADKDADGKTISGSAKAKKIEYINNLDLDYGQRLILYRSIFDGDKDKEAYNGEILEYLNSREDLSYEDIVTILEELDFKVYEDGTVEW